MIVGAGKVAGATVLALSRRAGRHLLYGLSVEIGNLPTDTSLDELSLGIFGAWCLRRLFGDSYPSSYAIAKVRAALVRPNSAQSRAWTDKVRATVFSRALRDLDHEIKTNESSATRYGLSHAAPKATRSTDVIDVFNRKFRRRVDNLTEFSTIKAIAGAGGYGTLSAAGLLDAGRALMDRVRTGDKAAVLVCLEILTHLTSEIVLKLPLQEGCEPSAGALAWIDVRAGSYFQSLYRLVERGARPVVGTAHLYEETSQIVEVQLHPLVHAFLLEAMNGARWTASSVEDLLGAVGHNPRSSVVGDSIYRSTARRLQESVPALLLGAGHHRWPVALATNSHFLVSRGRPSYGACQAGDIDATTNAAYRLLGWPTDDLRSSHIYYGQEEFTLDVDNELITFQAHNAVRSAIADDNPVNVVMTVVGSRSESIVLRGFVKITQSSVKSSGLQAGGAVHHFRFIRLEGWQKTLLEAACWLQLPICLVATETVSTYTLQQMPADVLEVQNWDDLLEWTLSAIWRIREAKNEASLQDRRDAT